MLSTNDGDDECNNVVYDPNKASLHKELKWKIPFTTLKQLDRLERDWSSNNNINTTNPKWKLHHMPDILLEKPLFIKNISSSSNEEEEQEKGNRNNNVIVVKKWDWKEISKCFPIIDTCDPMANHIKTHSCHLKKAERKKIKFNEAVIQNVAILDQIIHSPTSISNEEMIKELNKSRMKHIQYNKIVTLQKRKNNSHLGTFLPEKRLDNFRIIQSHLKQQDQQQQKGRKLCELDSYRFKF